MILYILVGLINFIIILQAHFVDENVQLFSENMKSIILF